jgi:hypothetical protein
MATPLTSTRFGAFFVLCILALAAGTAAAQDTAPAPAEDPPKGKQAPLKVFVCAGQSNMVGKRSLARDLPEELKVEAPGILVFDAKKNAWNPMKPPEKGFGPEISFAHAMHEALGEPIGIIKHSIGGTALSGPWHPTQPGRLYAELRDIVKAAGETRPIQVVGMIWMQGGRDAKREEHASKYAELLPKLVAQTRKDFGNEKMFFVAGRSRLTKRFTYAELVRKAQMECKAEDYAWINCDDLTTGKDNLHFDTNGQVNLGKLFAEAMQRLMKEREQEDADE